MPEPWPAGSTLGPGQVPVSVVVLTLDEEPNLARCLATLGWAQQVVVLDSGSSDDTVAIARAGGATVVETHWRGFGSQREHALRLDEVVHDWVLFLDADEWSSSELADAVSSAVLQDVSACWTYKRLVFRGRWIRHCGWYGSSRVTPLMRRDRARFDNAIFSEHPTVAGSIAPLGADIVDEDRKGLASWLRKHVDYAELEAERRRSSGAAQRRPEQKRLNFVLKDVLARRMPARPLVQFVYMYVVRLGFLDGQAGLSFCLYHAWFQRVVRDLEVEAGGQRR